MKKRPVADHISRALSISLTGRLPAVGVIITHGSDQWRSAHATAQGIIGLKHLFAVDARGDALLSGAQVTPLKPDQRFPYPGKPALFNIGIKAALERTDAPYLWLTMNDVVLRPGALDRLIEYMDHHPAVGLLVPRFYTAKKLNGEAQWQGQQAGPIAHIETLAMMIRREALEQAGPFDESAFCAWGTSAEYPLRMWSGGWEVHAEPGAVADHLGATTNGIKACTPHDRDKYYDLAFGEWSLPLSRQWSGDLFGLYEWLQGPCLERWKAAGVPIESIDNFLYHLRWQFGYSWIHSGMFHTAREWKPRGRPVVLIVTANAGAGGCEHGLALIGQELQRRGYDVLWTAWSTSEPVAPWIASLPYFLLPDLKHGPVKNSKRIHPRHAVLAAMYDALRPAAVLTYYVRDAHRARAFSKHRPRVIEWINGADPTDNVIKMVSKPEAVNYQDRPVAFACQAQSSMIKLAPDACGCETEGGAQRAVTAWNVPAEVIPAPVELVAPDTQEMTHAQRSAGGRRMILRIGRLLAEKGPGLFNDLLAALGPEYCGVWIGPDWGGDKFRRAAPPNVAYLGPIYDAAKIAAWIETAWCVVSPSISDLEGTSAVMMEALARGKRCAATDSGWTSDIIRPGRTGLLVPLGISGAEFAHVLKNVSEYQWERWIEAALSMAEGWNINSVVDKWEGLING